MLELSVNPERNDAGRLLLKIFPIEGDDISPRSREEATTLTINEQGDHS
jgi:hypothetical protein